MKKKVKNLKVKDKKIIIIIGLVILIAISIGTFLIVNNKVNPKKEYKIVEVKPTISKLETGAYYIFGAKIDQEFEIEKNKNFSYEVTDENNKSVLVELEENDNKVVIKPITQYEEGKIYTIKIKNGTFLDEELKSAKEVVFSIERKSVQNYEYNDNVNIIKSMEKIEEKNQKFILNTKDIYPLNSIIIVENGNTKEAYKVESINKDNYTLTLPELNEVFKEYDYYGSAYLDLTEFEGNDEIKEYLAYYVKQSLLDKIIPTVNAARNIDVKTKWDKKSQAFIATVTASTNPNDKIFNKSFLRNHKFTFTYELRIKVKLDYDIDIKKGKYDVNITLEVTNTPEVQIDNANQNLKKMQEGLKAYTDGENVKKLLMNDYANISKDTSKLNQEIGKILCPTPIQGLNLEIGFGLIMEVDMKANMGAKLTNTNQITIGYNLKKGLYGNSSYNNSIDAKAFGEAKMRLGSQANLGLNFMNLVSVSGALQGGLYGSASLDIKTNITKTKQQADILAKTKAGLFSKISANAKVLWKNYDYTIFDDEVELYNYELPITATSKKASSVSEEVNSNDKEDKPVSKPEDNKTTTNKDTEEERKPDIYYTVKQYDLEYYDGHLIKSKLLHTFKIKEGQTLYEYLEEACPLKTEDYGLCYLTKNNRNQIEGALFKYNSTTEKNITSYNETLKQYNVCINENAAMSISGECKRLYNWSDKMVFGKKIYKFSGNQKINSNVNFYAYRFDSKYLEK